MSCASGSKELLRSKKASGSQARQWAIRSQNDSQLQLKTDLKDLEELTISAMSTNECGEVNDHISIKRQWISFIQRRNNGSGTIIRFEHTVRDIFDQISWAIKQLLLKLDTTSNFWDNVGDCNVHGIVMVAPIFNSDYKALLRFFIVGLGTSTKIPFEAGTLWQIKAGSCWSNNWRDCKQGCNKGHKQATKIIYRLFVAQFDRALPLLFSYPSNFINVY